MSKELRKGYCFRCHKEVNLSILKNITFLAKCPICRTWLLIAPLPITLIFSIIFFGIGMTLIILFIQLNFKRF